MFSRVLNHLRPLAASVALLGTTGILIGTTGVPLAASTACGCGGSEEIGPGTITFTPAEPGKVPDEPKPPLKVTIKNNIINKVGIKKNVVSSPFKGKTNCPAELGGGKSCVDEISVPSGTASKTKGKIEFEIEMFSKTESFTYQLESE